MAGWLAKNLGNGLFGLIDIDNPNQSPSVTAQVTVPPADTFTRILNGQILNTEELRLEKPAVYDGTFEYVGLAIAGSDIADPVWSVVRTTWVYKCRTRIEFRSGVAWIDKHLGW